MGIENLGNSISDNVNEAMKELRATAGRIQFAAKKRGWGSFSGEEQEVIRRLGDKINLKELYNFNIIDYILDEIEFKPFNESSIEIPQLFNISPEIYNNVIRKLIKETWFLESDLQYLNDKMKQPKEDIIRHSKLINRTVVFIKKTITKQLEKSLLTKTDFIKNKQIWISDSSDYVFDIYKTTMIMDMYTLSRMFAKFEQSKMNRGPAACRNNLFMTPRNIIFYGGAAHCDNYLNFIEKITKGYKVKYWPPGHPEKWENSKILFMNLPDRGLDELDSLDFEGFNFFEKAISADNPFPPRQAWGPPTPGGNISKNIRKQQRKKSRKSHKLRKSRKSHKLRKSRKSRKLRK